jgi:asparagine synthase (glutamine-hydrolysing)
MSNFFRFGRADRAEVYGPTLLAATADVDPEREIVRHFEGAPTEESLHRMIYCDLRTRFPEHTLMLSDRLAMAHGLELRSPLLDEDLADYCLGMPPALKIQGGRTKVALRKAAEGRLPREILERDKQGFMFPVAQWIVGGAASGLIDRLTDGPLIRQGWIDPSAPGRLVAEHQARRADHHVRIWMLLNLDAWYRIYVDGEDA